MSSDPKRPATSDSFDVIVIGAGPAGYPAAIRAAQNKLSVACIDEWKNHDGSATFGGTCLNAGCIPSKALLESTELYHRAQEEFAVHGIKLSGIGLDLGQMQKRKGGVVRAMTQGIVALFKAAGVTGLHGHGRLLPGRKVEFTAHDGSKRTLSARHVVLASGSAPMELRSTAFKPPHIVDSWGALEFEAVPKRLGVIGCGVIGLELGSVWRRLGSEVVIIEALPDFLAFADQQLAREALRHFKKQGLDIRTGAKVNGAMVADLIAGRYGEMNYKVIPFVIYTAPEIAWVGLTEEQVKASGRPYKTGTFPFLASGRARALEQTQGFAKIVAARDDDEILGVHIVGPFAGELIAEAVLAMEYSASSEDLQRTIHAHPTLAEAVHEAALSVDKRSIDSINR